MFGRVKPQESMTGGMNILPGDQPGIPQIPMPQQQTPENKRWLEGGKFGVKDAIGLALGAVGDAFTNRPVATSMVSGAFQNQRDIAQQEAQRKTEMADWLWKQQYERNNPAPSALERNVAAFQNFTPEQRAAYAAMQEAQQGPVTLTLPGNRIYSGPRSGLSQALGVSPDRPVGKLTPIEPTTQNTPAPQTGANGFPSSLTRQQYQATVAAMGKDATDAWMTRNNIRMGQ